MEMHTNSHTKLTLTLPSSSSDFPFSKPWVRFEQFLLAKHSEKAGQSMGTGSCYLLNAPENIQAELQILLALSTSDNAPNAT